MPKLKAPIINLNKKEDLAKLNYQKKLIKFYQTNLPGQGLFYVRHGAYESQEHSFQQHCIEVYLQPELNSLRKIGSLVRRENAQIGDIAIIPVRVNHWQRIEAEVSKKIIVNIEPHTISRISSSKANLEQVELLPTFAKSDLLIYHIVLNLKSNFDSGDYDRLYVESLFHSLLMHLVKNYTTRQFHLKKCGGLSSFKLRQAIDYINDNLDRPIKVNDVAEILDLSQFYFCHLFKKSTGIAPYKYIIQTRVQKAKDLLRHSKLALADIAYECGFSSQSQMTKHFHRCVGITPRAYRLTFK